MNEIDRAIRDFRADPENDRLFLEARAEIDLSERMTDMRLDAGLTQAELGERLGKTQAYVAKMEGGGYDRCGVGTLRTFCRALGHDLNVDAMFEPLTTGAKISSSSRRIVLSGASAHTVLPKNVIELEARRSMREAAVG
jgi:transcriptional regulator with XRE-family HTH domain